MTAKRPYREAMEWEQVREVLIKDSGKAFDPDCVEAIQVWHDKTEMASCVEDQLEAVERVAEAL